MALETNSERSGASSAHSGSPTRGARKRFSQSGVAAGEPAAPRAPAPEVPVLALVVSSVMAPFCAGPEKFR